MIEYGQVVQKKAHVSIVRLLVDSEKLTQAVDEFTKRLNACVESWDRHSEHSQ